MSKKAALAAFILLSGCGFAVFFRT